MGFSVATDVRQTAQPADWFVPLGNGIRFGDTLPTGWLTIAELCDRPLHRPSSGSAITSPFISPLIIVVGVTGVGKTTTLSALTHQGCDFTLLPNRRVLTDHLIISQLQRRDGQAPHPVDRVTRLAYTRRYRQQYPGGMAHLLGQVQVNPSQIPTPFVFDGLRGENEVRYAAAALPHATFVVLDAPDLVRLQRLLHRGDPFDHVALTNRFTTPSGSDQAETTIVEPTSGDRSFADLGIPDAAQVFDAHQEATILTWVDSGQVTADELRAKLKIVVEERRNYDPQATIRALRQVAGDRTVIIDSTRQTPQQAAQLINQWLQRGTPQLNPIPLCPLVRASG